ncbi:hypothetical protein RB653_004465 [Dictyostelium firmibasis]|uniref:Uncharacterized protein n=1 Tax=Dictyostelium firmibasis TaxID=79012 RepID=A0AAN7YY65_9MYCE
MINNETDNELIVNIIWNNIHEICKEISITANVLSKTDITQVERDNLKNDIKELASKLNKYLKMVGVSINDFNQKIFQNECDQDNSLNKANEEKSKYYIGD